MIDKRQHLCHTIVDTSKICFFFFNLVDNLKVNTSACSISCLGEVIASQILR